MESKFQRCFTCIFDEVRKPCLQEHPAVRLSGLNLTPSTACWTTWPVMREQRPGSDAWCVGVMNNVFTTSTRRRRRRVDVMKTLSLRHYCGMCSLGGLNRDLEHRPHSRQVVSLTSLCCSGWPAPMNTPQGQQRELGSDGRADFNAWLESDLVLMINFNPTHK